MKAVGSDSVLKQFGSNYSACNTNRGVLITKINTWRKEIQKNWATDEIHDPHNGFHDNVKPYTRFFGINSLRPSDAYMRR